MILMFKTICNGGSILWVGMNMDQAMDARNHIMCETHSHCILQYQNKELVYGQIIYLFSNLCHPISCEDVYVIPAEAK